jgi:foldase protein PrsA
LGEVTKGEEVAGLDKAIFSASKGVLSGPVKTPFGFYVFEVLALTPSTQRSLAQEKTTIKQQLSSQGGQKALEKFVTEFKKKWTAKTDCRPEFIVQDCKQYKAPKTPTSVPPAAATPQTTTTPASAPKTTSVPKVTKTK